METTAFILVGLLCFVAGVSMAEDSRPRADTKAKCYSETGLTLDDVKALKDATISPEGQGLINKYFSCFLQDRGILSADGSLDAQACKNEIRPEHLAAAGPVIDACAAERGANALETASKFAKCANAKSPELMRILDIF